ncbi:hypothetical protein BWP39_06670 [Paraburkholderia acidicola]|uniref:Carboxypeptidase family protein n=1 Tax=Paraburkholderia acidicola TaxID=1912599 RepID=A0A2A4F484_9BURK|nr:carboxypeptidase-like regulatory domain-containing protein [Paraburkholderia acidicola]PCE28191.1 hypothetical protein BWP39_06670 [Paraburkholderia acidicola]
MNQQGTQRSRIAAAAAAAVAAALTLGMAGSVYAQNNGIAGGTTTDDTSAGNTNGGGLPQVQHQGDVAFTSGGVGSDESQALKRAESHWPLSLRFTGPGSDYLADVRVQIMDTEGGKVLGATSRGPYMLVRLHPGRYTVRASYKGHDQSKAVTIPASGTAREAFYWNIQ